MSSIIFSLFLLPIKEHGRKINGFTLVELVITIAIVIILSVVSIPIYRGYTNNAKMAEGYALLGTILSAQKAYFSQHGNFLLYTHASAGGDKITENDEVLGIDARGNKYFTSFVVGSASNANRMIYYFDAHVNGPEDLPGGTLLYLQYNITRGARVGAYLYENWK